MRVIGRLAMRRKYDAASCAPECLSARWGGREGGRASAPTSNYRRSDVSLSSTFLVRREFESPGGRGGGGRWMEIQLKIPRCLSLEEGAAQGGEAEQHAHVDNESNVASFSSAA